MKRMKHRSDVGTSGCSENESCSVVLYFLEKKKKTKKEAESGGRGGGRPGGGVEGSTQSTVHSVI